MSSIFSSFPVFPYVAIINQLDKARKLPSINESLNEFVSNPMINNQLINAKKNVTSIIIYLNENNEFKKLKNKNISLLNSKEKRNYYKIKNELNNQRKNLINNIRNIIEESDPNYKYYLGGIDLIADDVISFVKKDIMIFSIAVLIIIVIIVKA